jgi:predicted NAD/FAD-binding protein
MVFNQRTYPNFCRLLEWLGVESQASDMSFSVASAATGLVYQGSSLGGLFAQRPNLLRPRFWGMLRDIVRFNRWARKLLSRPQESLTVGELLTRGRFGRMFRQEYLLPMTSAIWSTRPQQMLEFPAWFLLTFLHNHGLLQIRDRPQWRTIVGGSRVYVDKLVAGLGSGVRCGVPVERVERRGGEVLVKPRGEGLETFDAVVLATHADTSLQLLGDASPAETEILSSFAYHDNDAVLHTDEALLPHLPAARASWNYHLEKAATSGEDLSATVTYDLTRLQRIDAPGRLLLTLNRTAAIRPTAILDQMRFRHPAFSLRSLAAQERWAEINGTRQTYFCGAYWKYGFHEDGVASALAVTREFGIDLDSCIAASTADTSRTTASAP